MNSFKENQTGRGGARQGAGRKPGGANQKTREIADRASEEGVTPLEYMLGLLRDESQPMAVRFEAAKNAAPYIHPKLASTEAKIKADVNATVTTIELVGPDGEG